MYNTKFPSGRKEFVKVVGEVLKLDSKRGKVSNKGDSKNVNPPSKAVKSKSASKTPSRRPKVAMDRSMTSPSKLGERSAIVPGAAKNKSVVDTPKA